MAKRAFTLDQVKEVRARLVNGESTKALALAFGVSTTTIKNIRRNLYTEHPQKTGPKSRPIAERLWEHVDQRGPEDCWPWTGASRNNTGIPTIGVGGDKSRTAYRVMYEVTRNVTLDPSTNVLHTCRNARCLNPNHLYLGTKDEWAAQLRKAELSEDEIAQQRLRAATRAREAYMANPTRHKRYASEYQLERKLAAIQYKGGKCQKCDETHPAALQFHHTDPAQKAFAVNSKTLSMPNKIPWQVMREEIDKCELLCANCHAKCHSGWTPLAIRRKLKTLERYGLANIYEKRV